MIANTGIPIGPDGRAVAADGHVDDSSTRFAIIAAQHSRGRRRGVGQVLDSIVSQAAELLGASRAAIMLYHPDDETVEIMNIGTPAFPGRIVKLGEGLAGRVIQTGRPLVIGDYENWAGKISGEVDPPIYSAVGVPLRSGQRTPVGALTLHSDDPERRFSTRDSHVLELFADIAMLALSNLRLYGEVRDLNKRLERKVRQRTRALERSADELRQKRDELQVLLAGITRLQDRERGRIAQDIHDEVLQTVAAAVYESKALERSTAALSVAVPELGTIRELLHQLEAQLRRVTYDIRPVELEGVGLPAALQRDAEHFQDRYGITCTVSVAGSPRALPEEIEVAALRITKEALRNAQAHASPCLVSINLRYLRGRLSLSVRDDGTGFDPAALGPSESHLGLSGMRHRAQAAGGQFEVDSTIGHGTTIRASLPTVSPA